MSLKSQKKSKPEAAPLPKTAQKKLKGVSPSDESHLRTDGHADHLDPRELLRILTEVKNGNFTVRMPAGEAGLSGKVFDTLNEIISLNERMMQEFARAGSTQEGKLTQRIELPGAMGSWKACVDSLNVLISDLVHPTIEIANVRGEMLDLNRELLANIANLENTNKNLERFAFMASHDLQEPLRKIRIFSDRLFSKYKNVEEDVELIRHIQRAAERTQALITDILALSKIQTNPTDFTTVDLNQVLQELINDLEDEIQEKKAIITLEKLPSLQGSHRLMRPLFQNLITNALKYSHKNKPPVIKIRSESASVGGKMDYENKYHRIYVEDNGIGFDQKYSEEIFGMFRRLHSSGEFEGTGIGLALCKKIVEQHRGFISARSIENQGSTFIISFPFMNTADDC